MARFSSDREKAKLGHEFDWGSCGDFIDVPSLRKSKAANRVDGPASHIPGPGNGYNHEDCSVSYRPDAEGMFEMDFIRDFCAKPQYQPPNYENFTLQRMQIAF